MVYADGKVVTPFFKARPDTRIVNKKTGEVRTPRFEPDGGLHFDGTDETSWGTKWVIAAVRSTDVHGRVILDVDWVPTPGGEAKTAMDAFAGIIDKAPGMQGVIYDTALRGVHHQKRLREMGLLPVNRATAAEGTGPRSKGKERKEKSTFVETRTVETADGTTHTVDLFAEGGAIGTMTLTVDGTPLKRIRTSRTAKVCAGVSRRVVDRPRGR